MAAVLAPFIPVAVDAMKELVNRLWPDPVAQAKERAAALQHAQDIAQNRWQATLDASARSDTQQAEIQKIDEASPSFWKSGGRPGMIWVCVAAAFSDFVVRPYVNAFAHTQIPALDTNTLLALFGMLMGIGTLRSLDKWKDKV